MRLSASWAGGKDGREVRKGVEILPKTDFFFLNLHLFIFNILLGIFRITLVLKKVFHKRKGTSVFITSK